MQPHTEPYYARVLTGAGMAAFVVDSFTPRGVPRTGDDQTRVRQLQSDADAVAGFRWLAAQPWIDPARIIVLGMSRGGNAALHVALEQFRGPLRATDIRFSAYVAIATGGCNIPARDARTTGAPIFFMLAELDNGTPAMPCLDYAQRMRAAGNMAVRIAVYPGVYHAYEGTGGMRKEEALAFRNCENAARVALADCRAALRREPLLSGDELSLPCREQRLSVVPSDSIP